MTKLTTVAHIISLLLMFLCWSSIPASAIAGDVLSVSDEFNWPAFLPAIMAKAGADAAAPAPVEDGKVTSKTGRIWLDRNLGASRVATSSTDAIAYGDLYQWGRLEDGHESPTSPTTTEKSSGDVPGHGSFILVTSGSTNYDWRSTPNNTLWDSEASKNNPCPSGFRVPTTFEWEEEVATWSSFDVKGAYESKLRLPPAGGRDPVSGAISSVGTYGGYWAANHPEEDTSNSMARMLFIDSEYPDMFEYIHKAAGLSVRCIMD